MRDLFVDGGAGGVLLVVLVAMLLLVVVCGCGPVVDTAGRSGRY
ncbi:hypothetical protein [Streptomyces genisteinicus]|nr:hypothetical protein [Streptomyces genisteinicus]